MRRFAHAVAPWLAALACIGCAPSGPAPAGPPAGPFAGVWPVVREQADSLYADGQVAAATNLLTRAAAYVRAPYAADWQVRERRLAELDATREARRPPGERAELVEAARR